MNTKCGIVAFIGRPNVGKSSLLNRLVGSPIAITSHKPQSTRTRVVGLLTDDASQIIVADTPGILAPTYQLQRSLVAAATQALADADVLVHISTPQRPESLASTLAELSLPVPTKPVLEVLNKADLLSLEQLSAGGREGLLVSAKTGTGVDELIGAIREILPEGPFLYGADDLSSQHLRFFAAEFVREAVFEQLEEELPYSVHVEIEEFKEDRDPVMIRATIYVERDSQKGIVIGDRGAQIRGIGTAARQKIEGLLDRKVFLELWVKVSANWRRDANVLRRFGFPLPPT